MIFLFPRWDMLVPWEGTIRDASMSSNNLAVRGPIFQKLKIEPLPAASMFPGCEKKGPKFLPQCVRILGLVARAWAGHRPKIPTAVC